MQLKTMILASFLAFVMTACDKPPASSVSNESIEQVEQQTATTQPESVAEPVAENAAEVKAEEKPINNNEIQTLIDSTGRISIAVAGTFSVRDNEENEPPTTLFAQDQSNQAIVTVSSLGKLNGTPDEYFKKLSDIVKQQETDNPQQFSKTKVGIATNNRMNYRFMHNTENGETAEMCMAIIAGDDLYSVCANGENLSFDALNTYLQDVRIAG
ncbi:MAG: hypothetical protein IKH45_07445 [Neisseriaceae bacterium]|nr:hypothetical protein [Neisseriaceae bacterium]